MKKTILIVDDNQMFTEFLADYLEIDYQTEVRYDAETALAEMDQINPDLVLVDHNMSGSLTGIDFLRNLKISGFLCTIPTILVTGQVDSELRINALAQGADDVICKPFNPKELLLRVKKAMHEKTISIAS